MRFHERLEEHLDDSLRDPVTHGRNTEEARTSVALRNLDAPHWWRKVGARGHSIPDLVEIALQVFVEHFQRFPIHPSRASVCFDPLVRLPNELLGYIERLCLTHRLLLLRVGP